LSRRCPEVRSSQSPLQDQLCWPAVAATVTRSDDTLIRGLGPIAATSIVVGVVIGTGVFLKARVMTCNVGTPELVVTVWVGAGVLSLAGALTYGELCALMPRAGGEYVFIREAYGRVWGFLFGWMRFFIGSTGSAAALATGFAIFVNVLTGGVLEAHGITLHAGATTRWRFTAVHAVAIAAVAAVTLINCAAVSLGGRIVSALTSLKVALVVGLGMVALLAGRGDWGHFAQSGALGSCEGVSGAARGGIAGFGAAMMAALWAYNGWNEMTYVAGEVKDPQRNLPRALIGGLAAVAVLYVFINTSYFYVLSPVQIASVGLSSSVATHVMAQVVGPAALTLMAGAMAGSIFSALLSASLVGARVPYAMANDGLFFRALAPVSRRTSVPARALFAQAAWTTVLVLSGSFDTLTDYAIFAILLFWGMTTGSLFLVRRRMPHVPGHYRTLGYPVVPASFLLVTGWLLVNTLITAPRQSLGGLALIALGLPFYWYWSRQSTHRLAPGA
jgi:basic amino acid/polyamine antiporter, APA family